MSESIEKYKAKLDVKTADRERAKQAEPAKEKKLRVVVARVPEELAKRFEEKCEREDLSLNRCLNRLIKKYLNEPDEV